MATKKPRQELVKHDIKSGKASGRSSTSDRDITSRHVDISSSAVVNGNQTTRASADPQTGDPKADTGTAYRNLATKDDSVETSDLPRSHSTRFMHSPKNDGYAVSVKPNDKSQKRASAVDDSDRQIKYRKGEGGIKESEEVQDGHVERRGEKNQLIDLEKPISQDQSISKGTDRIVERVKARPNERHDREYRERADRSENSYMESDVDKSRDRSQERFVKERSVERGTDRNFDRTRYVDISLDRSTDDRLHGQGLPPPPPLPVNMVPHSVGGSKREEDLDRRIGSVRHSVRLSPGHEEKERKRSEESLLSQEDAKRRREDDTRERKRDERDGLQTKVRQLSGLNNFCTCAPRTKYKFKRCIVRCVIFTWRLFLLTNIFTV